MQTALPIHELLQPPVEPLLRLLVGEVVDQDETLDVCVEDVSGLGVSLHAAHV